MRANKLVFALAASSLMVAPTANAVQIAGDALEVYGKWHMSVDFSDDDSAVGSNTSISSNSSRLGFKGKHAVENNSMDAIWQIETEINPDHGGDTWAGRNSFVGVKGGFGTVIFGLHDTPFKSVAGKWDMFGDTIGDRRAILGASHDQNNIMNQRGKNALMYMNTFGSVAVEAMYSADGGDSAPGKMDVNDNDMTSVSAMYHEGPLSLAAAYEDWSNLEGNGKVNGTRVTAGYDFGQVTVGAIFESTEGDTYKAMSRSAMGVNAAYKSSASTTLKAQFLSVDDADDASNTGATMTTVGVFNKLDKQTDVYLAYTQTSNDDNATFGAVDGGHGDKVIPTTGGASPSSFSAGLMYKF